MSLPISAKYRLVGFNAYAIAGEAHRSITSIATDDMHAITDARRTQIGDVIRRNFILNEIMFDCMLLARLLVTAPDIKE